jgi:hypothetical protein
VPELFHSPTHRALVSHTPTPVSNGLIVTSLAPQRATGAQKVNLAGVFRLIAAYYAPGIHTSRPLAERFDPHIT